MSLENDNMNISKPECKEDKEGEHHPDKCQCKNCVGYECKTKPECEEGKGGEHHPDKCPCKNCVEDECKIKNKAYIDYYYIVDETSKRVEVGAAETNITATCIDKRRSEFKIRKIADRDYTKEGDYIKYTVMVINTGNVPLSNIVLHDKLDKNVKYVNYSAIAYIIKDKKLDVYCNYNQENNKLELEAKDRKYPVKLQEKEILTFEYTVKVNDRFICTEHDDLKIDNKVLISAKGDNCCDPEDQVCEVSIPIKRPIIKAVKKANKDCVKCNESLIYTIEVKNTGNVDATNVVIKDMFANEFKFDIKDVNVYPVGAAKMHCKDSINNVLILTIKTLKVGERVTICVPGIISCCGDKKQDN